MEPKFGAGPRPLCKSPSDEKPRIEPSIFLSPHSLSDPARLTSGRNVDREIHIGKEHDAAETDSANTPWTPLTLGRTSLHTRAEAWEYVHLRQNLLARLGILQS